MREEDSEGRGKLTGPLGVRGSSLVMLTGSPKSRHFTALLKHSICMQRKDLFLMSVDSVFLKLRAFETSVRSTEVEERAEHARDALVHTL